MNCQWDDYVDQMRKVGSQSTAFKCQYVASGIRIATMVCLQTQEHGGNVWSFSGCVAVYINDELIGDLPSLLQWVVHHHGNIMPEYAS